MALLLSAICTGAVAEPLSLTARVEGEVQQLRVEQWDTDHSRWLPVASGYREHSDAGWLKVALPHGVDTTRLRVRVSDQPSPFAKHIRSSWMAMDSSSGTAFLTPGVDATTAEGGGSRDAETPDIEESDIWAVRGQLLYYFNHYRGLQLVDLSGDVPQLLDVYRWPARGESLYVLADGRILLISKGGYGEDEQVELLVLGIDEDGKLHRQQLVDVASGNYLDSRRYGDTLYIATRSWEWQDREGGAIIAPDGDVEASQRWQVPVIELSGWDLTTGQPVTAIDQPLRYTGGAGYDAVLHAQPGAILLALTEQYNRQLPSRSWRSVVHVLQPDATGRLDHIGTARTSGVIRDKFKFNYADGTLTTISQRMEFNSRQFSRETLLENFRLDSSASFARIGSLALAPGETLFATRFHGDTVYVVTFLVVDPLFAVDNSDPQRPRVAGELKIPGWSDYLEWAGDYLFAIGPDEGRLAVSQFDVSNPADMRMVDRLYLAENSWASSEAQYNDKAISFFSDRRLMILPYTEWNWGTGDYQAALQLIGWDDNGLTAHGSIQHIDTPRRGVLSGDSVVSISGRELLTTSISSLEEPLITGKLSLAWSVDRLFPVDDHLIMVEGLRGDGFSYYRGWPGANTSLQRTSVWLAEMASPDMATKVLTLPDEALVGAVYADDGLLHLLTEPASDEPQSWWQLPEQQQLRLRIVSMADPADPAVVATVEFTLDGYLGADLAAHVLPSSDVLWLPRDNNYGYGFIDIWMPWPGYRFSSSGYLITASGSNPAILASEISDREQAYFNGAFQWHSPYLMRSRQIHLQDDTEPHRWQYRHLLDVVDLTNPAEPLRLPSLRIPAMLKGAEISDPLTAWLYFEEPDNTVSVYGWDGASAFELYRKKFPSSSGEGYTVGSWPEFWLPPFHGRRHYDYRYSEGISHQYTQEAQVWWYDRLENAMRLAAHDSGDNYIMDRLLQLPYPLLLKNSGLEIIAADRQSGTWNELAVHPVPSSLGWAASLHDAQFIDNHVWVPFGLYGVEAFPAELPQPQRLRVQMAETRDTWRELPAEKWHLGDTQQLGQLHLAQWLYRPDSMLDLDPEAADLGDFTRDSSWFGQYRHSGEKPLTVIHTEHGEIAFYPDVVKGGLFWFDHTFGFVWTHASVYPWIYAFRDNEWMAYMTALPEQGRAFWSPSSGWLQD